MDKVFAVSDATGKTANRVLRAALAQFDHKVEIIRYGEILTVGQIDAMMKEAAAVGGFVVHTLVSEELRRNIMEAGHQYNVPTIDLIGPLLIRLEDWLDSQPKSKPGLFHTIDEEYDRRIEAIEFTVQHDDGRRPKDLHLADIVLIGVSRTSKTPLSMYLANHGWKVANIPLVYGIEPPRNLFSLPRRKVVALTINPERLANLREVRAARLGTHKQGYADMQSIRKEVAYAYQIFDRRRDWPLVDVTAKPIEEAAAEISALIQPGKGTSRF